MKSYIKCLLLGCLWVNGVASAQELIKLRKPGEPRFWVDFLCSRASDPEKTYLEVFYQVNNDALQFVKTEDGYIAKFEVVVTIYDARGRLITGDSGYDFVKAKTYDKTNSTGSHYINQFSFILNPGTYLIKVQLTDLDSKRSKIKQKKITVPSFAGDRLAISDLQLARRIVESNQRSKFHKHGRLIIPNVSRIFGTASPDLFLYYEIYNLRPATQRVRNTYQVTYRIRDSRGRTVMENRANYNKPGASSAQSIKYNVEGLSPGRYIFEMEVLDNGSGQIATASREFFVNWPYISLVSSDYDLVIDQLRYIATTEELKKLKNTPVSQREEAFAAFWKRKDPTPGTPRNELMEEYYRRINYANEHFFSQFGQGWKTDQGSVYIIFGPPDVVHRHPLELATRPYEVWEYYDLDLVFVFVDRKGVGEYELLNPFELQRFLGK